MKTQDLNDEHQIIWFDDFEGSHPARFLSNFYVGDPLVGYGVVYPTGEHMFAAHKATTTDEHRLLAAVSTPGAAKRLGRKIRLREDWEFIKYDVMRYVLRVKFAVGRPEAQMLLETGDALLVEGTYWSDRVWGVDLNRGDVEAPQTLPGRNWLGTLLMARRAELRAFEHTGWQPNVSELIAFVTLPDMLHSTH